MQILPQLLRTRVARSVLFLFLLCALVPTAVLAVLAYHQVVARLGEQSRDRLRETGKTTGLILVDRIEMAESEVRSAVRAIPVLTRQPTALDSTSRLTALVWVPEPGGTRVIGGRPLSPLPALTPDDRAHLASGHAALKMGGDRLAPSLWLAYAVSTPGQEGVLWGEVRPSRLWQGLGSDTSWARLAVLAGDNAVVLVGPRGPDGDVPAPLASVRGRGDFTWSDGADRMVGGYWTVFLRYEWNAPAWTVIVSEPEARILAPIQTFRRTFVLVVLITLVAIFLLSNRSIDRRMQPLLELQRGTQQVALGDFSHRVTIRTHDEFERLGGSFNHMAERLGRQFSTLAVINDIGRAILSELKSERLGETVIRRFREILPARAVGLVLRSPGPLDDWHAVVLGPEGESTRTYRISAADQLLLRQVEEYRIAPGGEATPTFLPLELQGSRTQVLVLPLEHEHDLAGFIAVQLQEPVSLASEDITNARRLADQVGVALANTRLLERLEDLSWGTLAALARTIDANSSWTAGHSERVTRLSLALGRELGLPPADLDRLHRGGLLHDIGKVGIPSGLLDKPGKLSDEEMALIRSHPATGAEILAPISVFADILPIVRHHHEKLDGTGYPDGLARAGIPYLARVVAVADVYDALVSDRPYRSGWTPARALEMIRSTAGNHHDPAMVEALVRLFERGELDRLPPLPATRTEPSLSHQGAAA